MQSVSNAINQIQEWNENIDFVSDYYDSASGTQLLAANCMLITAIGEGINRVLKILPNYLESYFPNTPWKAIVGMRNHLAHGYFEIDADIVFDAVKTDIPGLKVTIDNAISKLRNI